MFLKCLRQAWFKLALEERARMAAKRMATKKKDPAVNALAREGGLARARTLTPEERREIAKKAAQTRWERYRDAQSESGISVASVSHMLAVENDDSIEYISNVEIDAYAEIRKKVRNHTISPTCPCDECVDSVIEQIRGRYLKVLAKIDRGEKLDKDEGSFFRLLTGEKANRWTRVFRQECKESKQRP
jgi:hypothetical protein